MTPLAILAAAVDGTPAPRIPIFCNLFDQGFRLLGMRPQDYYADGANVASGQLQLQARYGYDNVWSLFYVGREAELLGCQEILYSDDGPPNVSDFIIKDYDDIARLEIPDDITDTPIWEQTGRCLAVLRNEVGERLPICAYITASSTLPAILMGMDKWMELLLGGPADVRDELLRKCSDFCRKQLAAYRAGGANVLIYSSPFGTTSFVGKKRFEEFSLPWMKRDLMEGPGNITYYCGMTPFNNVIEPVMAELGIGSFYISPLDDLAQAKTIIGQRGLTCGVINDIKMLQWSSEDIRNEVRRICHAGMPGGHFLFGTGVMPLEMPDSSIRTMLAAAHEYGSYP